MSEIIPLTYPMLGMDFKHEARIAALNEACAGANIECTPVKLCMDCENLAIQIESRLVRAFLAGQASMYAEGIE